MRLLVAEPDILRQVTGGVHILLKNKCILSVLLNSYIISYVMDSFPSFFVGLLTAVMTFFGFVEPTPRPSQAQPVPTQVATQATTTPDSIQKIETSTADQIFFVTPSGYVVEPEPSHQDKNWHEVSGIHKRISIKKEEYVKKEQEKIKAGIGTGGSASIIIDFKRNPNNLTAKQWFLERDDCDVKESVVYNFKDRTGVRCTPSPGQHLYDLVLVQHKGWMVHIVNAYDKEDEVDVFNQLLASVSFTDPLPGGDTSQRVSTVQKIKWNIKKANPAITDENDYRRSEQAISVDVTFSDNTTKRYNLGTSYGCAEKNIQSTETEKIILGRVSCYYALSGGSFVAYTKDGRFFVEQNTESAKDGSVITKLLLEI